MADPPSNGDVALDPTPDEEARVGGWTIRIAYADEGREPREVRARAIHMLDYETTVGPFDETIGTMKGILTLAHLADEDDRPLREWAVEVDSVALVTTRPTPRAATPTPSPPSPSTSASAPASSEVSTLA